MECGGERWSADWFGAGGAAGGGGGACGGGGPCGTGAGGGARRIVEDGAGAAA